MFFSKPERAELSRGLERDLRLAQQPDFVKIRLTVKSDEK